MGILQRRSSEVLFAFDRKFIIQPNSEGQESLIEKNQLEISIKKLN